MEIDSLDIEEAFNAAADLVQLKSSTMSDKTLMDLYGLYKMATIGACKEPQPGMFNLRAKAKWKSWNEVSGLSKSDAMKKYVEIVRDCCNWEPKASRDTSEDAQSQRPTRAGGSLMGNTVSQFAVPPDDHTDADSNPIFSWAKDCDLVQLEEWAKSTTDINVRDDNGLTPLHWAVDRGHLSACNLLLRYGADPSLTDNDGSSSLDYAETCEYTEVSVLLKQHLNK